MKPWMRPIVPALVVLVALAGTGPAQDSLLAKYTPAGADKLAPGAGA